MGSMPKQEIVLVAWDPESLEHVERLYQQRIACGWNEEDVEEWRGLQRSGKMALQWVVLADSDPLKESKLAEHVKAWPLEAKPIADTANSLSAKPRTPVLTGTFVPVGHISLDAQGDDVNQAETYKISSFYVSVALQGGGLGRAAMDAVEHMAISEPLCAKWLMLSTPADIQQTPQGQSATQFSRQRWYERRGYEVYQTKLNVWKKIGLDGSEWWIDAVFMRKNIT